MIVRKLEIKIDPSSLDQAIREAEHYLAHADPVMRRLIARHGPCPLAEREFEPFHMLANSIISQQLSTKAAATIKQRVGELVGVPFQTEKVLAVSSEKLRDAGLSQAKARYIRELAARVVDGRLIFDELMAIEDEAVIEKLIEANGIGRWTAEMFLLFGQTIGRACARRRGIAAVGENSLRKKAKIGNSVLASC